MLEARWFTKDYSWGSNQRYTPTVHILSENGFSAACSGSVILDTEAGPISGARFQCKQCAKKLNRKTKEPTHA